jgi:cytochrome c
MRRYRGALATLAALLPLALGAAPARAEGDPAKGEKVFARCKTCHEVAKEQNKVGPHLVGVMGRKAGAVEGFKYSDAMKNSGIVWDDAALAAYLKDPKGSMPGNKMAFPGLKKDDELADVIAYLKQAAGGA